MLALLAQWEKINKYKQGKNYHDQRNNLSSFVIYVDGMMGREALVVLMTLSRLMAAKMEIPISHVWGWVNSQIEIAVIRLYS